VRVSDRKGDIDVPAEQVPLIDQIYKSGKPVITLGFGSPYLIERFPQADTWLSAFGISDVAQISAARALFGEIPVRGHLPVTIPGAQMKIGYGMEARRSHEVAAHGRAHRGAITTRFRGDRQSPR
jgi:beta-N-acetylhexosaminidase